MPEPAQSDSQPDDSLSVLVLVGDALRRDALAMQLPTGGPTAFTRRLDQGWIRFERCYAAAPWTLPATTSLLTATDPFVHEHWSHRHTLTAESLVPAFPTAHRAAIINNSVLTRTSGLSTGFEPYRWISDTNESFAAASEFLRERAADGASYFLMVHSNLPHDYYLPDAQRRVPTVVPRAVTTTRRSVTGCSRGRASCTSRRGCAAPTTRACCDCTRSSTRSSMPRRLDRTIVLVLADHGEGFEPELARIHHGGRVHDDLVRVPCALWLPPNVPDSVRTRLARVATGDDAVGVVDLLPTLLGAARRPCTGRDLGPRSFGLRWRAPAPCAAHRGPAATSTSRAGCA